MEGHPINRVLVDIGEAVNILPIRMMKRLNKGESGLILIEVTVTFSEVLCKLEWVLPIELIVGNKTTLTMFFLVDSTSSYNALLGRGGIHSTWCFPLLIYSILEW